MHEYISTDIERRAISPNEYTFTDRTVTPVSALAGVYSCLNNALDSTFLPRTQHSDVFGLNPTNKSESREIRTSEKVESAVEGSKSVPQREKFEAVLARSL